MKPVRVAVLNSHPIQYAAPLYAYLGREPSLALTALYCTDYSLRGGRDAGFGREVVWDVDLLAGYHSVFLGERAKRRSIFGFWSLVVPEVWTELRSGRYDAVILHGYAYAAFVLAFVAAKTSGVAVMMRSETHDALDRPRWKRALRDGVLRLAYRFVDRFLAVGTANAAYYRRLGVPAERIHLVPYTVDNERFIAASSLDDDERAAMRRQLGLPADKPVVMFVSKFQRRKHPEAVLLAAARLRERGIDVAVLMVGTGELDADVRQLAEALALPDVVFPGFINQSELPRVYAVADVFVLPSSNEPWGFIINEVMCAAVPVVVSDDCGSVPDLVHDGENGRVMRAGDPASLADALADILSDRDRARRMGARSREIISGWDYERCRQGIAAALVGLGGANGEIGARSGAVGEPPAERGL
jgi:glycosyltransferase involved in cell wall biosynthesis